MSNRILVTYTTRTGSTAEVAEAIGQVLTARGFAPVLTSVKEKPSVQGYYAVVMGSSIRMGAWLLEMIEFIRINQTKLNQIPTAIFTVHMYNTGNADASSVARKAYTIPVWKMLTPVHEAFVVGKINPAKLSLLSRVPARIGAGNSGQRIGDYRDWDRIRIWSETLFV